MSLYFFQRQLTKWKWEKLIHDVNHKNWIRLQKGGIIFWKSADICAIQYFWNSFYFQKFLEERNQCDSLMLASIYRALSRRQQFSLDVYQSEFLSQVIFPNIWVDNQDL